MRNIKNTIFYVAVTGIFSALMYYIVIVGSKFEEGRNIAPPETGRTAWQEFIDALTHNLGHPLAILLAQIVIIIFAARFLGWVCQKIRQPTVIGEIIAGIILGPSLLGLYFPEFSAVLFPAQSLGNLQFLSQIGLILFMFIVGMELDLNVLKDKARDAVVISHASIIIPFALGMGLAYFIYREFAPANVQFSSFGLFLGIAMSITAFPVLARIVQERGIHKTRLGTIVITCAAADDISAWCLLAAVIAIVKAGSFVSALYTIALAVLYVLFMIKVVRPFLKRVGDLHASRETLSKPIVGIFFLTLIISAYATEVIGIHALFGAFMAGAIMPENVKFRNIFIEKVEDVALVLLLPLFFVFTGLRTQIGLLNEIHLWEITGLIILVAIVGKFIGSALAAKFVKQSWKDSLTIGALMNTRGLMELVVLNIGYDLGVLTPQVFAMMVIMALVTTFITGPALDLINWAFSSKKEKEQDTQGRPFKILISFGNPERGRSLLRLANAFIRKLNGNAAVTALHFSSTDELNPYNASQYEYDSFAPVKQESEMLGQEITTVFRSSNDIDADIAEFANKEEFNLLLIGMGQSIFEGSLLGKIFQFTRGIINPRKMMKRFGGKRNSVTPFDERTMFILSKTQIPVGVLVDREFHKVENILVPVLSREDRFLTDYAQKLVSNSGTSVTLYDPQEIIPNTIQEVLEETINTEQSFTLLTDNSLKKEVLRQYDLVLASIDSWPELIQSKRFKLADLPSTLLLKN